MGEIFQRAPPGLSACPVGVHEDQKKGMKTKWWGLSGGGGAWVDSGWAGKQVSPAPHTRSRNIYLNSSLALSRIDAGRYAIFELCTSQAERQEAT